MDFYKNGISDIVKTFNQAISQSKKVIVNNDNTGVNLLSGEFVTYGLKNADYIAKNITYEKNSTKFDILYKNQILISLEIILSGMHNVYNTLAVIAALNEAGVDLRKIKDYFKEFTGMGRRFEKVCEFSGIEVFDDYAHHPTEIKATLDAAAQKFGKENVVAVFQPHRYTRLKSLWNEFKTSFNQAGRVIITDVYAASEDEIKNITGENFAKEICNGEYMGGSISEVAKKLLPTLQSENVVVGLGAGTITNLGKELEKAVCVAN